MKEELNPTRMYLDLIRQQRQTLRQFSQGEVNTK